MRGTNHSRDEHPFLISGSGIEIFAPRLAIRREPSPSGPQARCKTQITKLDEILGPGIPWGSSLLIGGVAGTGKTVLSLEFIYRGALAGEKGILFSFEETDDRLRAAARGLGWDLGREIDRGMIEIVFIPQPDILVEAHLLMMQERIEAMKAKRVVIDSVSVFLHKMKDPQLCREKIFQLCSIVQNAQAVGFFTTDIPYGSHAGQPLRRRGDRRRRRHHPQLDRGGVRARALHRGVQAAQHGAPQGPAQPGDRRRAASRSSRATATISSRTHRRPRSRSPPGSAPGFPGSTSSWAAAS